MHASSASADIADLADTIATAGPANPTRSPADLAADFTFDPASELASLRTIFLTLLRSAGQIVLQPNAATGACVLAAWLLYDPRLAIGALCGSIAANLGAILAGHSDDDTRAGLHGFNGALAGLAAFHFIADDAVATAIALLAGTGTAWLLGPWSRFLQTRVHETSLAVYSSPCLLITWLWLGFVQHAAAPAQVSASAAIASFQTLSSGIFAGLAQTGFASGVLPGVLVWLGIAASSRRHALWALAGAGLATTAHLLIGASPASLDAGLPGFNGALTAIALAGGRVPVALGGVLLSVALQSVAARFGLPAMTAPFVIATWSAQWGASRFATARAG